MLRTSAGAVVVSLVLAGPALAQGAAADRAARVLIDRLGPALAAGPEGAKFTAFVEALAELKKTHGFAAATLVRDEANTRLAARRDALLAKLDRYFAPEGPARRALARELARRRKAALKYLFSRKFTRAAASQAHSQTLTGHVKAAWTQPVATLKAVDPDLARGQARLAAVAKMRAALLPDTVDEAAKATAARVAAIEKRAGELCDPRVHPSSYGGQDKVHALSLAALAANKVFKGSATEPERAVMALVNEYRQMMGLRACYYTEALIRSARSHSDYMNKIKRFAHRIKGHPAGYSCKERAQRVNYRGLVLENIAAGPDPRPEAVHAAWLSSPGHHRAILDKRVEDVGVARSDQYWTELFGTRNARNKREFGRR